MHERRNAEITSICFIYLISSSNLIILLARRFLVRSNFLTCISAPLFFFPDMGLQADTEWLRTGLCSRQLGSCLMRQLLGHFCGTSLGKELNLKPLFFSFYNLCFEPEFCYSRRSCQKLCLRCIKFVCMLVTKVRFILSLCY